MKYDVWSRQEILRVFTIPKWKLVVSESVSPLSVCVCVCEYLWIAFSYLHFEYAVEFYSFPRGERQDTRSCHNMGNIGDTAVQLHLGRRDIFTPHCGGVGFLSIIPKVRRDVCDIVRSGGLLPCVDSFHGVTQIYWVIAANPRDVEKCDIWFEYNKFVLF